MKNCPPTSTSEIGFDRRISMVIEILGGVSAAAEIADISISSISRYRMGGSHPPYLVAAKLAISAKVRLAWLATGDGPIYSSEHTAPVLDSVDTDLLEEAAVETFGYLKQHGLLNHIKPSQYGVLLMESHREAVQRASRGVGWGQRRGAAQHYCAFVDSRVSQSEIVA